MFQKNILSLLLLVDAILNLGIYYCIECGIREGESCSHCKYPQHFTFFFVNYSSSTKYKKQKKGTQ